MGLFIKLGYYLWILWRFFGNDPVIVLICKVIPKNLERKYICKRPTKPSQCRCLPSNYISKIFIIFLLYKKGNLKCKYVSHMFAVIEQFQFTTQFNWFLNGQYDSTSLIFFTLRKPLAEVSYK